MCLFDSDHRHVIHAEENECFFPTPYKVSTRSNLTASLPKLAYTIVLESNPDLYVTMDHSSDEYIFTFQLHVNSGS